MARIPYRHAPLSPTLSLPMTQTLYVLAALLIGAGSGLQVALIGSIGRLRGATEAAWISALGTFGGMAVIFSVESLRHNPPNLPSPFNLLATFVAAALLGAFGLTICMKGLDPYLAVSGLFGFTYLLGAGYLAPRIGVALFASAVTVGTLGASVGLDHIGAFGGVVQRVSVIRAAGLLFLLLGVVMVRSGR
jgi:uncharacterized membrane protein YdcZ (DUF606 family)